MIGPALVLALLVGAWELYADLGSVQSYLLPAPHQVAQSLLDDRALLWDNFTVTAGEIALGLAVACLAGVLLAAALHLSRVLRRALSPLLIASQSVPVPLLAPVLVVWLGFDLAPKVAIVALVSFFPIVVTTLSGLQGVDPELHKLMRTLDASRWRTLWLVDAPSALPALFSGLRIAVAVSTIGAVFAELAGSSNGLGHLVTQATAQLDTARAWAAIVILSVFAVAMYALVHLAERRLVPWSHASRATAR